MTWTLPLGALSSIAQFNGRRIPSDNHYQYTTDSYSELWPWRSYRTSPHMPPHMNITRYDGRLSDGYLFITPYDDKAKDGVHEEGTGFVMTMDGDLVFTPPSNYDGFCGDWLSGMTDLRKQTYKGKKYLMYWNGCNTHGAHWGKRWGRVTFLDEEYRNFTINPDLKINSLDNANKGQIDVHEHQMTDDDTMVVSSYNNRQHNMSSIGGAVDTWVVDSCFFEIDIATEEVLFSWHALDHVPLENMRLNAAHPNGTKNNPFDWFHINAIQKIGKNYLISSRHHFAAYFISGEDGSILWELDGQDGGDFGSIPQHFQLQHHVRAQNITDDGMTITLFNNHGRLPSQAVGFWLPLPPNPKNPPQLVRRLEVPGAVVHAGTQGSYQINLGNGNAFVGYGKIPLAREFGQVHDGGVNARLLWEGRFGYNGAAMSYRAFKQTWHGTPAAWDPVVLIEKVRLQRKAFTKVFVSWNGATDIAGWAIFAGESPDEMKSVGLARKQGFETVFHLEHATCVQLGAVRNGAIIRGSNIACLDPNDEFAPEIGYGTSADATAPEFANYHHDPLPFPSSSAFPSSSSSSASSLDDLQAEKDRLEADKADLEAQTASLQSHLSDLESELSDLESDAWFSYRLFAEVACGVVAIVAATWAYILWRERRAQPHAEDGGFGDEGKYYRPGLGAGLGAVMGLGRRKRPVTPDIRVHQAPEFEEMGPARGKGGEVDAEAFGLVDEDDEEEEDGVGGAGKTTARTPFLRQTTGK